MNQMVRALVASICVVAAQWSGGPSVNAQQPTTLLVWDTHTDEASSPATEAIYQAFERRHPTIKIKREVYQNEQIRVIARTALESGTGPDVVYYDTGVGNAGVLARAGLLRPIDDYAKKYGWNEKFLEIAAKESIIDGKLFGLGLEFEFVGLFYNEALLAKAGLAMPRTFTEVGEFCKAAKAKGYTPMALSMNPGWQSYHWFSAMAYNVLGAEAMGSLLFQRQGRWDTPDMVRSIRLFFVDLKQAGCFPDDVNSLMYNDASALFYSGEALIHPTGTWLIGRIAANMPGQKVGLVAFPPVEAGQPHYYPTGVGSSYFISAKTKHADAAALLLDYIFSPEAVRIWVEKANYIPPVPFDSTGWTVPPLFRTALDTLATASGDPGKGPGLGFYINHAVPEAFVSRMRDGSQAVLAGRKTPEQLAAEFQQASGLN